MKKLTLIFLMLLSLSLYAQKDSLGMPLLNGLVGIQKVITLDSTTSKEIYQRAKLYFAEAYKSAKDVIQLDDAEQGVIVGKAFTKETYTVMLAIAELEVWYMLRVECKEGRYRYTIENVKTTNNIAAEQWWKFPNMNKKQRALISKALYDVSKNLEISMSKPSIKKEDKW